MERAVAIAGSRGFELVHGIVDSLWLRKPGAALEDFWRVCVDLGRELELPIGFEGRYRWIVFLSSKVDPRVPVLNRYYGVLEDGTVKVRGIELRRHDTPGIVNRCQAGMLGVLSRARDSFEFKALVPEALSVLGSFVEMLREGRVPLEELLISKSLSKNPDEYSKPVPQAIAARLLAREGGRVHAGQRVDFVLTRKKGAVPAELVDDDLVYDWERYRELLVSSAESLLLPFGYDRDTLARIVSTRSRLSIESSLSLRTREVFVPDSKDPARKKFKLNPFSDFEHRPIDCNIFTNESALRAEALHPPETRTLSPKPENKPKTRPDKQDVPRKKSAGGQRLLET